DYERARRLYQESLEIYLRLDTRDFAATATNGLGVVARHRGDHREAATYHYRALLLSNEAGSRLHTVQCLAGLGCVAAALGRPLAAARLYGKANALDQRIGGVLSLFPRGRAEHERVMADLRDNVGQAEFAAAWAEGGSMTFDQAEALGRDVVAAAEVSFSEN